MTLQIDPIIMLSRRSVTQKLWEHFDGIEEIQFSYEFPNAPFFEAYVQHSDDSNYVVVNYGTITQIHELWDKLYSKNILYNIRGNKISVPCDIGISTTDALVSRSLTWLLLHEFMHIRSNHLSILGRAQLTEYNFDDDNVTERKEPDWFHELTDGEKALVRPCLELQADNDATEVMLGTLSEVGWDDFRIDAACIFVVMALMDRAEKSLNRKTRTYPLVATRFFTLFSQMFQYWLFEDAELADRNGESFVVSERSTDTQAFKRFAKEVLALSVNDVIMIALHAGARDFIDDMGQGKPFFEDLYEIQYADDLSKAKLGTKAAQEWRTLYPLNEKIMRLTGQRKFKSALSR